MKTSSKLLITLAIAIFILPFSILSYTVSRGRVGIDEYSKTFHAEATQIDKEDQYLKTTALTAFQKVQVLGSAERPGSVNLIFVKSDKYAVKIDKNKASYFKTTVNAEGVLSITGDEPYFYHNIIYIFTPSAQELILKHVGANIEVDTERLTVQADSVTELRFSPESAIGELVVEMRNSSLNMSSPTREAASSMGTIRNATLHLVRSDLRIETPKVDKMQIKSERSKVVFDNRSPGGSIHTLELHTQGENIVSLDSLRVGGIQGTLSEETTIDLPIHQLRKLITNK
ncbi:hypothetical protein [Sphingobacterium paludis]|uniref:Adhesin domain-containing protein n=1 Tax=Sphingobacterium paludis TaxID=1476465 RepID=A0A4R7CTE8_9SPHI|nr:hypothetical protein [Sphingobacterium paludis]TDS11679.1 hypothetical protein B0I21_10720 [Sphingobacterium paludis]